LLNRSSETGKHGTGSLASLFFLVLFLLVGFPTPSNAQSAANLFEAGRKAFEDGMYVMAGRNFRQLVDQFPDSNLADDADYLSAVADFYLGEFRSCIATLKEYSRKYPRSLSNSRVSYWLASACFQIEAYREALKYLDEQLQRYPDEQPYFDHSLLLRGMVEENLADWTAAQESYRALIDSTADGSFLPQALYRSGGIYLHEGRYREALTAFTRILVEFPNSTFSEDAVFFSAECAYFLGRYAAAERSYRTVLAGEPGIEQRETSMYRLASILGEQGRQTEALEICNELELRFPKGRYRIVLDRLKADLLFDLGRYREAARFYEKALQPAESSRQRQVIYYNLGLSAYLSGDIRGSIQPLQRAFEEAGAGSGAGDAEIAEKSLFRLAVALSEIGAVEQATRRFEEFRGTFPGSDQREEAIRFLATLYREGGRFDAALVAYTDLITRYPFSEKRDEYFFNRAAVRATMGSTAAALNDFFSILESWPDSAYSPESRYNVGYIYSQRGEYKRALPYFEAVLDDEATEELAGRATLAAGVCSFNAGEYEQALEWFDRNIESQTGGTWVGESLFYIGRTYYKLSRLEEAEAGFGRAALALEGTSQGEESLFWQGLCQFRLNDLSLAKATFSSLTSRYPNGRRTAESYYRAGMCAVLSEEYAGSVEYFDKALQVSRSQGGEYSDRLVAEILFEKGISNFKAGNRQQALDTFKTLGRQFPDTSLASEGIFKMAEEDFRSGNYRQALEGFNAVMESYPESAAAGTALYWAGKSAARTGERAAALDYLFRFLELAGTDRESDQGGFAEVAIAEIRQILTEMSESGGQLSQFEDFYRRVESSPSLAQDFKNQVRFEYARTIFADRPDAAMAVLQILRSGELQEPLRAEVNYLVGEYYKANGELDRAYDIFMGITASTMGRAGAASQLAIAAILEVQGHVQKAAEEYLKVHFLYPDQTELAAEGLYHAGRLYWEQRKTDKAEQLFSKMRAEYPDSPWLEKIPED